MNEQQFVLTPAPIECVSCPTRNVQYFKVPMYVDRDAIVIKCAYCSRYNHFTILHNVIDEDF